MTRPPCYHPPATTTCIDHCWHRGMTTETCCHCGQTQRIIGKNPVTPPGHGPFIVGDYVLPEALRALDSDNTEIGLLPDGFDATDILEP